MKLKEFRSKANLNQKQVADYLSISQSGYHKLESGKSLMNAKQILDLCDLFKCTPNDLLGFRGVHTLVADFLDAEKNDNNDELMQDKS